MNNKLTLVICLVIFVTACSERSSLKTVAKVNDCNTSRLSSYSIDSDSQNNLSKMVPSIAAVAADGLGRSPLIEDLNCIMKKNNPVKVKPNTGN